MERAEFVEFSGSLTDRQAEAFYRRHVEWQGRQEVAEAMGTTPSNVDNAEREARDKIRKANNLLGVLEAVGYEFDGEIGTCARCDEAARELRPDPRSDAPLVKRPMLCPDCDEDVRS